MTYFPQGLRNALEAEAVLSQQCPVSGRNRDSAMAQAGEASSGHREQRDGAATVPDIGGADLGDEQVPLGAGYDVALATLDLLAGVIAARTDAFAGPDAGAACPEQRWR